MEKETEVNVMYFHGATIDGYRFTISGYFENNILTMGISVCSKMDLFCKARGRSISAQRALNQKDKLIHGKAIKNVPDYEGKGYTVFNDECGKYMSLRKNELLAEFNLYRPDGK